MRVLAVLLAGLVLSACDSQETADSTDALVGTWELVSFTGEDTLRASTLTFGAEGQFSATTPCNAFQGAYSAFSGDPAGNKLDVEIESWTLIACPPDLASYEVRYAGALERIGMWGVDLGELTLWHPERTLTFRRTR